MQKRGFYQIELLAGRKPVSQGTLRHSHKQEGRAAFPGELPVSLRKEM